MGDLLFRDGGRLNPHRNCAFHAPAHKALLLPEKERVAVPPSAKEASAIDTLPAILLPLAGPEEFDLDVGSERSWKVFPTSALHLAQ